MTDKFIQRYLVYIQDEDCYGIVENLGAHISLVRYNLDGIFHTVHIENEDLIFLEEIRIGIRKEEI